MEIVKQQAKLAEKVEEISKQQAVANARIEGLDKRFDDANKRIDILLYIMIAIVTGILDWLVLFFGTDAPPQNLLS